MRFLFSPNGRASRLGLWLGALVPAYFLSGVGDMADAWMAGERAFDWRALVSYLTSLDMTGAGAPAVSVGLFDGGLISKVVEAAMGVPILALAIRRAHDLGTSAAFRAMPVALLALLGGLVLVNKSEGFIAVGETETHVLAGLIAVLGAWALWNVLALLLAPGKDGATDHGSMDDQSVIHVDSRGVASVGAAASTARSARADDVITEVEDLGQEIVSEIEEVFEDASGETSGDADGPDGAPRPRRRRRR